MNNVRSQRRYVAGRPDREQELDAIMGFVWDCKEATWLDFRAALAHFRKENGHYRVPQRDESPCGVTTLGCAMSTVRSNRRYVVGHPDRLRWLLRHPNWRWTVSGGKANAKVARRYEEAHAKVARQYDACLRIYCVCGY